MFYAGQTDDEVLANTSAGGQDVFLNKYTVDGIRAWTRQAGSSAQDFATGVATNGAGNSYVLGYTDGDVGRANLGSYDAFVLKYDPDGVLLWSAQFGTEGTDWATAIAADAVGNVFVAGHTTGSFAGGVGSGNHDLFLSKLDASGNLLWTGQYGSTGIEQVSAVALSDAGLGFVGGKTYGNLVVPNRGDSDGFVVALIVPEPAGLSLAALAAVSLFHRRRRRVV